MVLCSQLPDHNPDAFKGDILYLKNSSSYIDDVLYILFNGAAKWDSLYFLFISKFGYIYENSLAFSPGFPLLINFVSDSFISFVLNKSTSLLISGVLVNILATVATCFLLYSVTFYIFRNSTKANLAVLLFCLNPANVFFTVNYSEAVFFMLTMLGHFLIYKKYFILSLFAFSLTSIFRFNGLLNFGYWGYVVMTQRNLSWKIKSLLKLFSKICCGLIFFLFPIIFFHIVIYRTFCQKHSSFVVESSELLQFATEHSFKVRQNFTPSWCYKSSGLFYSFIQKRYWNVGFLKYFEWKQIPNFILATPIIIVSMSYCIKYFMKNPRTVFTLGLSIKSSFAAVIFPFVVHVTFLVAFGFFNFHVQILTRMICSSSPIIYWIVAESLYPFLPKTALSNNLKLLEFVLKPWKIKSTGCTLMLFYFLTFSLIGYILHCNFLPWT